MIAKLIAKVIGRAATPIGVKLGGIVMGAMVGIIIILWLVLMAEQRHGRNVEGQLSATVAAHEVTRASLRACRGLMDAANERARQRSAAAEQAQRDSAAARSAAERAFASTAARVASVRAGIGNNQENGCATPFDVRNLGTGL